MRWTPQDIKAGIAYELDKQGSTLQDFESALEKQALGLPSVGSITAALKGLGTVGAGSAAALGLGAAGLGYGAYKGNQDSDDKIQKKLQEKQQYEDAIRSLQAALQENQISGMR
jgi:hypothetical protein